MILESFSFFHNSIVWYPLNLIFWNSYSDSSTSKHSSIQNNAIKIPLYLLSKLLFLCKNVDIIVMRYIEDWGRNKSIQGLGMWIDRERKGTHCCCLPSAMSVSLAFRTPSNILLDPLLSHLRNVITALWVPSTESRRKAIVSPMLMNRWEFEW